MKIFTTGSRLVYVTYYSYQVPHSCKLLWYRYHCCISCVRKILRHSIIMVHIKCTILLSCVSLVALGISANDEKNEAFAEDILALRQELNTLKQEIKLLKQEVAKPLNPNRKQDILDGKDQALMDLNNPQREKSRQERLLVHPTMNTSSPGNCSFFFIVRYILLNEKYPIIVHSN